MTAAVRLVGVATALVWAVVAVMWKDGPFALTYDDAYYYLEIARRFADGQGSTFDGLNRTNGYHPLWMLICSIPFFAGLSAMAALRLLLVVQAAAWAATWWFVGGVVGRTVAGWPQLQARGRQRSGRIVVPTVGVAALVVAANPTIARIGISGLESALVLLFGAAIIDHAGRGGARLIAGRALRWRLGLGGLLALAVLSRTDHVLLVGAVALAIAFEPRDGRTIVDQARRAVPILVLPAAVTGAYFVSNQIIFGSTMQISGEIKRRPLTPGLVVVAVVVAVAVVALIRFGPRYRPDPGRLVRTRTFAAGTAWYGAFCLALLAYYTVFQVQQWLWYFAPLLLWGVICLLLFVLDLFESALAEAREAQSPARALLPLQILLGLPLLVGLGLQWRSFTDPEIRSIQVANKAAAEWIGRELPADAVLASWDAGILGYFAPQPVVNIDGVVNSHEWHEATQAGPEAVRAFLDADGVGYIVNHGASIDVGDPSGRSRPVQDAAIIDYARRIFGPKRADAMELVKAFPFTYSGSTVGSGGRGSGTKTLAVFVYRIPPAGS